MKRKISVYEVEGEKYFAGVPNGINKGKYLLKEACMIRKEDLPKGKSLDKGLKEAYMNSKKEDKAVYTERIMSPEPRTFFI